MDEIITIEEEVVTAETPVAEEIKTEEIKQPSWWSDRRNRRIVWIAAIIIIVAAAVWFLKSLVVAATVNGQPISRFAVIGRLEKTSGKTVLEQLIQTTLIKQEAANRGIVISEEEMNAEFDLINKNLEKQKTNLDDALKEQGITKEELRKGITTRKQMEKIIGDDKLNVSDQEVEDYIKQNEVKFNEGTNIEESKASIKDIIKNSKFTEEADKLMADLTAKAKINYWVNY